jgi:hypothetical protein
MAVAIIAQAPLVNRYLPFWYWTRNSIHQPVISLALYNLHLLNWGYSRSW